jgi:hypothetical protein
MKSRIKKAYLFIPAVYVVILLGLVALQFATTQRFSDARQGLSMSGRRELHTDMERAPIRELQLSYRGVIFSFSPENPLTLRDTENTERQLNLVGYTPLDNGFEIHFSDDISVQFAVVGDELNELAVQPFVPQDPPPPVELFLPYKFASGASGTWNSSGVFEVSHNDREFYLAVPSRAQVNEQEGRIELPGDIDLQTVRYYPAPVDFESVTDRFLQDGEFDISDQAYLDMRNAYINMAYRGWADTRFNGGSGTWSRLGATPRFDERILTAYLAEAWNRNDYTGAFNNMRRAADQHPDEVGLLSSPFLGDLDTVRARFLEDDSARAADLLRRVRNNDVDVFTTPKIMQFARDRANNELLQGLMAMAERVDPRELDMPTAIGVLQAAIESRDIGLGTATPMSRFLSIAEEQILPEIVRVEEGFFLRTGTGQIDLEQSVRAGVLLDELGATQENAVFSRAGRNLVSSALSLSDQEGFLPRTLFVRSNELHGSEGALGPELVYEDIHENPNYPYLISLHEEVGPGSWVYTIIDMDLVEHGQNETRFTLRYPRNRTHYIIMQGIEPFEEMELFGQAWRNDPFFESYIKGRNYVASSRTLLIKYNDNSVNRDIVIRYN